MAIDERKARRYLGIATAVFLVAALGIGWVWWRRSELRGGRVRTLFQSVKAGMTRHEVEELLDDYKLHESEGGQLSARDEFGLVPVTQIYVTIRFKDGMVVDSKVREQRILL